jgi:homocysteine S-methyltransferase
MGYAELERSLEAGGVVILDGGTGTELERRGVSMDPDAWCGPASLHNADVLTAIHRDYIDAGARIVTANTYASSRLMLEPAGFGDAVAEINRTAVHAARRAREASGRDDVLVAGSLSHMCPLVQDDETPDRTRVPSPEALRAAFEELATLLAEEGCDLVLCEMVYDPERAPLLLDAAIASGLPVWVGFSARRGADGQMLGHAPDVDVPLAEVVKHLEGRPIAAAGVMHTASDLVAEALDVVRARFDGPLYAYPDSGHFRMPHWQFEAVIPPDALVAYARRWRAAGVQGLGGCCGLSPAHVRAVADDPEIGAAARAARSA